MFNLKDYKLNEMTIDWLNKFIKDNTNFDENKFEEWLKEKNVAFKSNPSAWLRKVFPQELERGAFEKRKVVVGYPVVLVQVMREKGIHISSEEGTYITVIWQHYIDTGFEPSAVAGLNHKIVDYMQSGQGLQDYIALLKKSKTLAPYKINWEDVDKDYQKLMNDWDEVLSDLPPAIAEVKR